jgi:CRP-like cAMP-binding protein
MLLIIVEMFHREGRELTELADRPTSLLLPKNFTHEEIGQMICSSRETVTRLLAMLSRRQIVQITSDMIVMQDRSALQDLALR